MAARKGGDDHGSNYQLTLLKVCVQSGIRGMCGMQCAFNA